MGVETGKTNYRAIFLVAATVVLCGILAFAAILIPLGLKEQKYQAAIKAGNNFYKAGDYQSAIQQYQTAIALNDKKDAGYLNLASAYMSVGQYAQAEETLRKGYAATGASSVNERMAQLSTLQQSFYSNRNWGEATVPVEDTAVALENGVFDMVATYTYNDYFGTYRDAKSVAVQNNQVIITYDAEGIVTTYYDLPDEKVLDMAGTMPVVGAKPCSVSIQNLNRMFSGAKGDLYVSFDKLNELFDGQLAVQQDSRNDRYFVVAEYKKCKVYLETDVRGNLVSANAWNQIEPVNRSVVGDTLEVDGTVSGYIQDAVSARGMHATLTVRARGSHTGTVIKEFGSAADGSYTYGGKQGLYTVEVSADGFVTEYVDIEIVRGQNKTGKNIVLSPTAKEGEIRIVLTWGSSPMDLDSHAVGRSSSGANFHISYENKAAAGVGELDVDDQNGFGPETITIHDSDAEFTYSIIDFTESGNMSMSGAIVKVYIPGQQPITYTIPSGSGNTWDVFKYQNGQVTPINTIY